MPGNGSNGSMGAPYLPRMAEVVGTEVLTDRERVFQMKCADGKELGHIPGQLVQVSVLGIGEAPISISSSPTRGDTFQLAVRQVGNVTNALHRLNVGDTVGIRGPYGNGFPVEELAGRDILFVAGGIGLFPLRSLIQYVLDNRGDYGRVIVMFGARTPDEQIFLDELAEWKGRSDVEYHETVDVGDENWKGNVGVITTLFPGISVDPSRTKAVVVGPPIMYRFVIADLLKKNIAEEDIILSLERKMKCGLGQCGHCQMGGYYTCTDGPVFTYGQLKKVREAV